MTELLADRYDLLKTIGRGSFGQIWLAFDRTLNRRVAIKVEKQTCPHPQLLHEAKVLRRLQGGPGLPQVFDVGSTPSLTYMAENLLGPTIEELFCSCKHRLSVKSVAMIGEQVLCRLHYIHAKHYLHRDMKPDNWLVGLKGQEHLIYVVDFGLAKKYRNPCNEEHIEYREGKNLTGTSRYTSINTHLGIEQSRRDDLEGLAYVLIYLLRGSLPWQGLPAKSTSDRYRQILSHKMSTPISTLCHGLPPEIAHILTYARSLSFAESPDYSSLRKQLKEMMARLGALYDFRYDWSGTAAYARLVCWKGEENHDEKLVAATRSNRNGSDTPCELF